MKKMIYALLTIFIIYFAFTIIAPPLIEKSKNRVHGVGSHIASKEAEALFNSLDFIADLHCDALLWNRNLTKRGVYGHVDFPRMQAGNMALQGFTLVTKSPSGQNFTENSSESFDNITALSIGQRQPLSTWFSLVNRAVYQCEKLHRFADKYDDHFHVIKSKSDFEKLLTHRKTNKKHIGGFLGIEGAHCLEGKIENFEKVYDAGVRMLGPAHFFDNEMGGSAHGIKQAGLTEFGWQVLEKMSEKNMIIDVAHSSTKVIDDIIASYDGPILTSHTGVQGIYNSPRNLSDKHLKSIAAKDGLIGIALFEGAMGDSSLATVVKTMRYTINLTGIDHVALGSDFDGSVSTPFDCTGFALLVDEMLSQGFTQEEIRAIMGENVKRFMLKSLP